MSDSDTEKFFTSEQERIEALHAKLTCVRKFRERGVEEKILDEQDQQFTKGLELSIQNDIEKSLDNLLKMKNTYEGEVKVLESLAQSRKKFFETEVCNKAFAVCEELLTYVVARQKCMEAHIQKVKEEMISESIPR